MVIRSYYLKLMMTDPSVVVCKILMAFTQNRKSRKSNCRIYVTRMHSSGMRTAHLLTVSQHALAGRGVYRGVSAQGGVCLPKGGVCLPRGCLPSGDVCHTPPGPEADTPPGPEADTLLWTDRHL